MRFIGGPLKKQLLQNLIAELIELCIRVRVAVPISLTEKN